VELLSETLTEERRANELLTSIADDRVHEIATERRRAAELQVKANWTLYGMCSVIVSRRSRGAAALVRR
jgi:hypothetical protein